MQLSGSSSAALLPRRSICRSSRLLLHLSSKTLSSPQRNSCFYHKKRGKKCFFSFRETRESHRAFGKMAEDQFMAGVEAGRQPSHDKTPVRSQPTSPVFI